MKNNKPEIPPPPAAPRPNPASDFEMRPSCMGFIAFILVALTFVLAVVLIFPEIP
jgi:hypothetical protein